MNTTLDRLLLTAAAFALLGVAAPGCRKDAAQPPTKTAESKMESESAPPVTEAPTPAVAAGETPAVDKSGNPAPNPEGAAPFDPPTPAEPASAPAAAPAAVATAQPVAVEPLPLPASEPAEVAAALGAADPSLIEASALPADLAAASERPTVPSAEPFLVAPAPPPGPSAHAHQEHTDTPSVEQCEKAFENVLSLMRRDAPEPAVAERFAAQRASFLHQCQREAKAVIECITRATGRDGLASCKPR